MKNKLDHLRKEKCMREQRLGQELKCLVNKLIEVRQPHPTKCDSKSDDDTDGLMHTDVIHTLDSCDIARMLVVLPDEDRRHITFTLPSSSVVASLRICWNRWVSI